MKLGVFTMWTSQAKVDAPIETIAVERPVTLSTATPVRTTTPGTKRKTRARRTKRTPFDALL